MMTYTMARGLKSGEPFDVKGVCEFTRELEMDAIDWVTTYGHDPAEVRRVTDDFGLKNICYTFFCDLNSPTSQERAAGREVFQKGIETAVVLGADKIMLPVPGKQGLTREQSFRNVVAGLKEVMDFARRAHVTVTIEHFPAANSPFIVSADVSRAVAEVPGLKVTFDNGNVTTGGESPRDAVRNNARDIVHAHFKDFAVCKEGDPGAMRCLDGKFRRAVLVGDGDVDQLGGLEALHECGYKGYINFEYEGRDYTPRDATVVGVARLREMMASLGSR
jgi:sugar phosphate isomerase/epimerase